MNTTYEPVVDDCTCDNAGPFSGGPHRHMGYVDADKTQPKPRPTNRAARRAARFKKDRTRS